VSDLVSRLLEAIQAKERRAGIAHPGPWKIHRDNEGTWITYGDEGRIAGKVFAGVDARFIVDNDPSAVLRRCEQDRWLVDWYVGWQGTFRGPIPEGHTEEGALHFRMASEFVFNRLLASYGIDWADDGGNTEEET
jgi:hypothetical protein